MDIDNVGYVDFLDECTVNYALRGIIFLLLY